MMVKIHSHSTLSYCQFCVNLVTQWSKNPRIPSPMKCIATSAWNRVSCNRPSSSGVTTTVTSTTARSASTWSSLTRKHSFRISCSTLCNKSNNSNSSNKMLQDQPLDYSDKLIKMQPVTSIMRLAVYSARHLNNNSSNSNSNSVSHLSKRVVYLEVSRKDIDDEQERGWVTRVNHIY